MKVTFFIDRPVFSAVISIVIVIVGIIGLTMLPVDQYPQITPPVVKISASYPGASALTVSQAVATPIEQEINGTPGMLYMESNSSNSGGFSAKRQKTPLFVTKVHLRSIGAGENSIQLCSARVSALIRKRRAS